MQPIILKYHKSTKGTHVFKTDNPDAAIQSVYVKRSSLPIEPPKAIELEFRYSEEIQ